MLNELTPEQEALCEHVFREYDGVLDSLPRRVDDNAVCRWLDIVYGFYDLKRPSRVEIVHSPDAAFALEQQLTGKTERTLDCCGIGDSGWVAFYDYFHRIGVLSSDEIANVLALREFQRSAWDSVLLDECAIVIALPELLKRDEGGDLHCADGPCIRWRDGRADYAWHGVWVPKRIILEPLSYTREEYEAIGNTEVRRALGERAGWGHIVTLLGASQVDEWTDANTGLRYALFASEHGKWIRKQSPVLQDGSQPDYFEPVHENLKTAQAARKWQASTLTPEECELDPVLTYNVET